MKANLEKRLTDLEQRRDNSQLTILYKNDWRDGAMTPAEFNQALQAARARGDDVLVIEYVTDWRGETPAGLLNLEETKNVLT